MRKFIFGCLLALLFTAGLPAQTFTTAPCTGDEGNTSNNWFPGHQERVCELRSTTIPVVDGQVSLSGENGGIEVIGEERRDTALEARVIVQDASREKAESMEREIKIVTTGTIHAEGPRMFGWSHGGWSVNYRLHVPRRVAAELHTKNGGISVGFPITIQGKIRNHIDANIGQGGATLQFETVNGGVSIHPN